MQNYSIGCNIWHCENGMCIDECNKIGVYLKDVIKHSKNIIDLIEVGDIIELDEEKYQVIYDESYNKLGILIPNKECLAIRHTSLEYIFQKNLKVKILTHEQYEKNCYKIGD